MSRIDKIVGGISKMVTKLQKETEKINSEVTAVNTTISEAVEKKAELKIERSKALRVINKLEALIS